jgi:phospholipid/cholesterol/gamma-HCH transport system ATP-binding protein
MVATPRRRKPRAAAELRAEHLVKGFGRRTVLKNVNLEVNRGEIVAVVGASGSGKTVMLDLLTGLLKPDKGRIMVADHSKAEAPLADLSELDWQALDSVRLHWAVVFQRNALFSGSVFDNIALWMREHTAMKEEEIEARVRESITAAALDVNDVIHKNRDELSGGMAKRVAIARAIAIDPALIFYDEPTTGLDPVISGQIHELIFNVHNKARLAGTGLPPAEPAVSNNGDVAGLTAPGENQRRTTIVVTHDKDLLRRLQPRIVMLHKGGIVFDGPYREFSESAIEPAVEYLREMPVLHARAG